MDTKQLVLLICANLMYDWYAKWKQIFLFVSNFICLIVCYVNAVTFVPLPCSQYGNHEMMEYLHASWSGRKKEFKSAQITHTCFHKALRKMAAEAAVAPSTAIYNLITRDWVKRQEQREKTAQIHCFTLSSTSKCKQTKSRKVRIVQILCLRWSYVRFKTINIQMRPHKKIRKLFVCPLWTLKRYIVCKHLHISLCTACHHHRHQLEAASIRRLQTYTYFFLPRLLVDSLWHCSFPIRFENPDWTPIFSSSVIDIEAEWEFIRQR